MRALVLAGEADHAVLLEHAKRWCEALTGEAPELAPAGDPAAAIARACERGTPVVAVATGMPRLGEIHAQGLREDLEHGADLVLGATLGGGWYLVALAAPQPDVLAAWAAPYRGAELLGVAGAAGLEVGLLRHERALESDSDRRALLADPLLAPEVRDALMA